MKYLLAIIVFFFLAAPSAHATWFNPAWNYRVQIEVQGSRVGSSTAVTNIPVYVDLANLPTSFWSNVQSDGDDVRVTESDGTTETAFELVNINTASSTGELHFLADSLATTTNSRFYLYYGNATATAYANTDPFGRNNVWSSYAGAYHVQSVVDAKGTADLTNIGTVLFTDSGQVGRAGTWASDTSNQNLRTTSNLSITSAVSTTISTWFYLSESLDGTAGRSVYTVFTKPVVGDASNGSIIRTIYEFNGGSPRLRLFRLGSTNTFLDRSGTLATGTWHHAAISWNASTSELRAYFNGQIYATTTNSGTQVISNPGSYQFVLGNNRGDVTEDKIRGRVDETRVASSVLSPAHILTEFNNQSSPSTFYVLGAEENNAQQATTTPSVVINGGMFSGGAIIW